MSKSAVLAYHQRTKHTFKAFAKGPETLDWDDQPDPFRIFEGCPIFTLPPPGREPELSWQQFKSATCAPKAMTRDNLGLMLELSFGLSAWKEFGPDRWALRCNPSSGNLHPSEAYIISQHDEVLPVGVYHYQVYAHHLEQRATIETPTLPGEMYVALSSVHWREAWKYGERAFRYCQHDAGHALGALSYAASLLGWQVELVNEISDVQLASMLGLDKAEQFVKREEETPDWLCRIRYQTDDVLAGSVEQLFTALENAVWQGKAQSLKAYHMYHWKVIDEIAQVTHKPAGIKSPYNSLEGVDAIASHNANQQPLAALIRNRRSAQHFSRGAEPMPLARFKTMINATREYQRAPLNSWRWPPAIHLFLFIHKVEGLAPGLYCLPRSQHGLDVLKQKLDSAFLWQAEADVDGLYALHLNDLRNIAKSLSCYQAIASDSAFSLGMLAEFDAALDESVWHYRRLFWESGLVGQVLYLEAEAAGFRGTGIGCFFDDEVHKVLGIQDTSLQSLYHFTIGQPLQDDRVQSLPAYAHLTQS